MRGDIQTGGRKGFTLIELLVVIAIIAVLIGLLLPAVQKVREAAARMSCQNNLKQIGLALYNYENVFQCFPMEYNFVNYPWGSWLANILPYIEQNNVFNSTLRYNPYPTNLNPNYNPNWQATPIKLFYCPSEPRAYPLGIRAYPLTGYFGTAVTDYVAIAGVDLFDGLGIITFPWASGLKIYQGIRVTDITDGTSNTIMVSERPPTGGQGVWAYSQWNTSLGVANLSQYATSNNWLNSPSFPPCPPCPCYFGAGPNNFNNYCSNNYLWSNHIGGANFTIGDGSVRYISYSASAIMPALATRAGGEVVSIP